MTDSGGRSRRLLVGMHDGVCAIRSSDGGKTWGHGSVTPLAHAAARLTVSPTAPQWGYLAAYEAGVYRTEDGGEGWRSLESYPSAYAHSVLMHPTNPQEIYVGSEPAAVFRSQDGKQAIEGTGAGWGTGQGGASNSSSVLVAPMYDIQAIAARSPQIQPGPLTDSGAASNLSFHHDKNQLRALSPAA